MLSATVVRLVHGLDGLAFDICAKGRLRLLVLSYSAACVKHGAFFRFERGHLWGARLRVFPRLAYHRKLEAIHRLWLMLAGISSYQELFFELRNTDRQRLVFKWLLPYSYGWSGLLAGEVLAALLPLAHLVSAVVGVVRSLGVLTRRRDGCFWPLSADWFLKLEGFLVVGAAIGGLSPRIHHLDLLHLPQLKSVIQRVRVVAMQGELAPSYKIFLTGDLVTCFWT